MTNIDSVRALDKQIMEHEKIVIKLKRARNSLLNISKLPPETLGEVFRWNVTLNSDFDGLEKRSHNFLFVCHHWFEVASHTPELWSFWGTTPRDWARRYPHSGVAPLDLVLGSPGHYGNSLDAALCKELEDRAAKDAIRRVHLRAEDSEILSSILSLVAAKCEGIRPNGVESFILSNWDDTPVDVSDFFSHYRFPNLRHLSLTNCTISPWDILASQTRALTTLDIGTSSPSPTTSQLLSILVSNPLLRKVKFDAWVIPDDDGGRSSFRVPLHHLKQLELTGDSQDVFRLLHHLDHPKNMEHLVLELYNCSAVEILRHIGPYVRDYLRGRGVSQNGLELYLSLNPDIKIFVSDAPEHILRRADAFLVVTAGPDGALSRDAQEKVILDLFAHSPGEVAHFEADGNPATVGNVHPRFPNFRAVNFDGMSLSAVFPEQDRGVGVLISLQHLFLRDLIVDGGDWSPLIDFLAYRVSSGKRLDTLKIYSSPHICPATVEIISSMVGEMMTAYEDPLCPFGTCSGVASD